MKEQIQQLITAGQTKDALQLLVQMNSDALLLQVQYNNGEKQFNLGLIEFSEWGRIQARINFAALEMAGKASHASRPEMTDPVTGMLSPEIFLAYNQKDNQTVNSIKQHLSRHSIHYVSDYTQLNAGQGISDFIANKALKSQFVLVLISKNSLKEGWAGLEYHLDILSNSLMQRNVIPLALDKSFADPGFIEEEMLMLEKQLDELDDLIRQKNKANQSVRDWESQKASLTVRYNNLPKIVQRLRNVMFVDISGKNFEQGMQKVLQIIQRTVERVASVAH